MQNKALANISEFKVIGVRYVFFSFMHLIYHVVHGIIILNNYSKYYVMFRMHSVVGVRPEDVHLVSLSMSSLVLPHTQSCHICSI